MLTIITVVSCIVIVLLCVNEVRKSRQQQPAIGALLMELSVKEQGIMAAYRRQIAEEAEQDAKIALITAQQIEEEAAEAKTFFDYEDEALVEIGRKFNQ